MHNSAIANEILLIVFSIIVIRMTFLSLVTLCHFVLLLLFCHCHLGITFVAFFYYYFATAIRALLLWQLQCRVVLSGVERHVKRPCYFNFLHLCHSTAPRLHCIFVLLLFCHCHPGITFVAFFKFWLPTQELTFSVIPFYYFSSWVGGYVGGIFRTVLL